MCIYPARIWFFNVEENFSFPFFFHPILSTPGGLQLVGQLDLPNLKNMVAEIPETGLDDNSTTNERILVGESLVVSRSGAPSLHKY
jgi:hypothetical protein